MVNLSHLEGIVAGIFATVNFCVYFSPVVSQEVYSIAMAQCRGIFPPILIQQVTCNCVLLTLFTCLCEMLTDIVPLKRQTSDF